MGDFLAAVTASSISFLIVCSHRAVPQSKKIREGQKAQTQRVTLRISCLWFVANDTRIGLRAEQNRQTPGRLLADIL
jgi:hypothetical protein